VGTDGRGDDRCALPQLLPGLMVLKYIVWGLTVGAVK